MSKVRIPVCQSITYTTGNNPVEWKNDYTALNAANMNSLSNSITDNRFLITEVRDNYKAVIDNIIARNAGWRAMSGSNVTTAEIFNDYVNNEANEEYSHAEGEGTIAYERAQHVQGKYNEGARYSDELDEEGNQILENSYAHIVGNGTAETRSNAYTLDWSGSGWFANNLSADGNLLVGTNGTNKHEFKGNVCFKHAIRTHSNLRVDGNSTFNGTSLFNGVSTFKGTSEFEAGITISGSIPGKSSGLAITGGTLTCNNSVYLAANATASTAVFLRGDTIIGNTDTGKWSEKNLTVTGDITVYSDEKEELSFRDIHTTVTDNLTVADGDAETVQNAINKAVADTKIELVGDSTVSGMDSSVTTPRFSESETSSVHTITGAKKYAYELVKNLLNAYILDEETGGTTDALDKLIEIAAWLVDDKAGAAKIISDVERIDGELSGHIASVDGWKSETYDSKINEIDARLNALEARAKILSGTESPSDDNGDDGDVYIQYEQQVGEE